jgi:hypothetical protein
MPVRPVEIMTAEGAALMCEETARYGLETWLAPYMQVSVGDVRRMGEIGKVWAKAHASCCRLAGSQAYVVTPFARCNAGR